MACMDTLTRLTVPDGPSALFPLPLSLPSHLPHPLRWLHPRQASVGIPCSPHSPEEEGRKIYDPQTCWNLQSSLLTALPARNRTLESGGLGLTCVSPLPSCDPTISDTSELQFSNLKVWILQLPHGVTGRIRI